MSEMEQTSFPKVTDAIKDAVKHLAINKNFLLIFMAFSIIAATIMYIGDPTAGQINFDEEISLSNFSDQIDSQEDAEVSIVYVLGNLFYFFGYAVLAGPMILYSLSVAQKKAITTNELLKGIKFSLPIIGVTLLSLVLIGVGLLLLIVPGIILALRLILPTFLIVDKKLGVIDSLKESFRITKGYALSILAFTLLIGVIFFIPLLIIIIFAPAVSQVVSDLIGLVYSIAIAKVYYFLVHNNSSESAADSKLKTA